MDMCRNAGGSFKDVSHCGLLMCPYLETGQVVIEKGLGNHGIWQYQKQYVRIVCKRLLLRKACRPAAVYTTCKRVRDAADGMNPGY